MPECGYPLSISPSLLRIRGRLGRFFRLSVLLRPEGLTHMADKSADRWSPGLPPLKLKLDLSGPMQAVGGLFAMSADAIKFAFRRPFQGREFLDQSWFIARVALAPTLLVAIPFTTLISFTLNILLRELALQNDQLRVLKRPGIMTHAASRGNGKSKTVIGQSMFGLGISGMAPIPATLM